ncbi:cytochrome P450 monooxygenase yanC [Colletotrichum liriopes]|uniref:Cytochrome P450 monooxygenase yanC n=1 Tax=Colletotrichum liriopes TaxID=708192 RepID=A0AA37GB68_9PEZI|nr:cytochrome P450 monooxygenase yanC [Colletotrichum liriopes]
MIKSTTIIPTDLPFGYSYSSIIWIVPAIILIYKILTFGSRERHLPPGPPTVPIIGNAHLIPSKGFYSKLKEWSDQYGSVYSLKVGQSTMVVLNDRRAVYELLGQKGAWYTDRPVDEQIIISTQGENIALMHEGPKWRAERKIAASYFAPKKLDSDLKLVQEAEIARLMHDLLEKPTKFRESVKRTTASVASITIYGHLAPDWGSFWAYISKAIEPGTYLPVDQFPILKLIPDRWNEPKQRCKQFYVTMTDIWNEARDRVENRRKNGDKRDSLLDKLLEEDIKCDVPFSYTDLNNFLGGLHMGASDTTATATLTSILFLAKHPEFQEKARVELDRLCGTERVPKWTDFNDLPYVNCIVKEGLRIRPVIPAGIPHRAKQDHWYDGMLIPAGSTIFIPAYALNHSSDSSPDPSNYNPDHFLPQANKLAPELAAASRYSERDHYSYGAGRRICVGFHLAERTQWRIIAQILWAFRIEPGLGPDGKAIELDTSYAAYEEGFLHSPKDYNVRFVPRSARHAEILRKEFGDIGGFLRRWE